MTLSVAWLYSLEKLTLDCPALVNFDVTSCYKLNESGMQLNCPALKRYGFNETHVEILPLEMLLRRSGSK